MTESPVHNLGQALLWIALTLTLFLVVGSFLAGAAGRAPLVLSFAAALGILPPATYVAAWVAGLLAKVLRANVYDRAALYVSLNLVPSGALIVAWVAHAARLLTATHPTVWPAGLLFFVGPLATVVAVLIVQEFFTGQI